MEKEKNTRLPLVDLIEVKPMQDGYRWVAITAMLFAIGIILHTVSPNVGGVTPNWTIAMYSIVINLTNPTLSQAVGIGFIAGAVVEVGFSAGQYRQRAFGGDHLLHFGKSHAALRLGQMEAASAGNGIFGNYGQRRCVYLHFKDRSGPAAARLAVCYAARGGDHRRAERHDHLFAVRTGAEAVFCAGGR